MKNFIHFNTARTTLGVGLLALALAACNAPVIPTVDSVSISGPSNNALKLGTPTAFTATAKDASGLALQGKDITWTSSNPSIASVDATGTVTAKKFGKVKISASIDGKTGTSAEVNVYGFQMACGTLQFSDTTTKQGTAFLFKIVAPDGNTPSVDASIKLNGPTGWKQGAQNYGYSAQSNFEDFLLEVPALQGTYKASAALGAETLEATCAINDLTQKLEPAVVSVGTKNSELVAGFWTTVPGALSYRAQVKTVPFQSGNTLFSEPAKGGVPYLTGQSADVYAKTTYSTSSDHLVYVRAYSVDLTQTLSELPTQFNASVGVSSAFKPSL